jgi:hypothetical protein
MNNQDVAGIPLQRQTDPLLEGPRFDLGKQQSKEIVWSALKGLSQCPSNGTQKALIG